MPFTKIETVAGAAQFNGTAGAGLFDFSKYNNLPKNTRIVFDTVAYYSDTGADPTTSVRFLLVRPGGPATAVVVLDIEVAPALNDFEPRAILTSCGRVLPRDAEGNWELQVITTGKAVTATVTVDFHLQEFPDQTNR